MPIILICRTCGSRAAAELADNQQELAAVGLLEQACEQCGKGTFWMVAQNFRQRERREAERRRDERRQRRVGVSVERRARAERRASARRREERRVRGG